jgi:hypothetical protein
MAAISERYKARFQCSRVAGQLNPVSVTWPRRELGIERVPLIRKQDAWSLQPYRHTGLLLPGITELQELYCSALIHYIGYNRFFTARVTGATDLGGGAPWLQLAVNGSLWWG